MRLLTRILYSFRRTAARTARPRGSGAGYWGPASDRAGVWGSAPRKEDRCAAHYEHAVCVAAARRRAPRAREEAARGIGAPQATEPGCGAAPHVRRTVVRLTTSMLCAWPQHGGAHRAPARKRRGVLGPRKRPSRGVGQRPTLESYAATYENSAARPSQ